MNWISVKAVRKLKQNKF